MDEKHTSVTRDGVVGHRFNTGDIVRLRSYAMRPLMTVREEWENGHVDCDWFDGDGHLQQGRFYAAMLKLND